MALTVTLGTPDVWGSKRYQPFKLSLDSSYVSGGESLSARDLGLSIVDNVMIEPAFGRRFEYDHTNNKVMVFDIAPPVVFEEVVTVTSNVGTLKYPAAFIMSVSASTTHFHPIPGGMVPATGQVAVSNYTPTFTKGTTSLTFLAGDTVTSCTVTYATQSWGDLVENYVFAKLTAGTRVYGNAGLTFTPGTPDVIDLGEAAVAIGVILWNNNGTYKEVNPIFKGSTAATKESLVDWSNSTNTTLTALQSDTWDAATDSVYIVYIKKPAAGFLATHFKEEDDLTPSSDVVTFAPALPDGSHPILWGTAGAFPGLTTKFANIVASTATIGTGATSIQPTTVFAASTTFTLGSNHADTDHLKPSYIAGPLSLVALTSCEYGTGRDLSDLSDVRGFAIGS